MKTKAAGVSTIYGYGTVSCAKFLNDIKKDTIEAKIFAASYYAWVSGFVSAAGLYNDTQKQFLDVADAHDIQHLTREYCEKNPLKDLADAAGSVANQLIDRAGRL